MDEKELILFLLSTPLANGLIFLDFMIADSDFFKKLIPRNFEKNVITYTKSRLWLSFIQVLITIFI